MSWRLHELRVAFVTRPARMRVIAHRRKSLNVVEIGISAPIIFGNPIKRNRGRVIGMAGAVARICRATFIIGLLKSSLNAACQLIGDYGNAWPMARARRGATRSISRNNARCLETVLGAAAK